MNQTQPIVKEAKKSKLLIKKRIPKVQQVSKYSYLFKHKNNTGKCPMNESETYSPRKMFIQDIFCFRKINSIVRNDKLLCLKLKETKNQRDSLQNHIQKFRDSKIQTFRNFGKFLNLFDEELRKKFENYSRSVLSEGQSFFEKQLSQTLSLNKNKKYVCFYYGPSTNILNFSQILISNELLTTLGYEAQDICDDFLKYKHIFFEIFEISLFDSVINIIGQNYEEFLSNLPQKEEKASHESRDCDKEKKSLGIRFDDFVFRNIKKQNTWFQEKVKARFKFSKPNVNTSMIELESIDESAVISCEQKKIESLREEMKEAEQVRIQKELEFMKRLMHRTSISQPKPKLTQVLVSPTH